MLVYSAMCGHTLSSVPWLSVVIVVTYYLSPTEVPRSCEIYFHSLHMCSHCVYSGYALVINHLRFEVHFPRF